MYNKTAKDKAWDTERQKPKSTIQKQKETILNLQKQIKEKDDQIQSIEQENLNLKGNAKSFEKFLALNAEEKEYILNRAKNEKELHCMIFNLFGIDIDKMKMYDNLHPEN